jgi:undecaprenyl-diphosphatase
MIWKEIHQFDQGVSLEINSWDSPFTDAIWQFFSNVPVWIPMYLLIAGLLIWKLGWKKGLVILAAAGLTFGFCDQLSNLIKDAVGRVRPLNDTFMLSHGLNVLEKGSSSFSFFSAHAANAFGLATCTYIGLSRLLAGYSEAKPKWLKAYGIWMFIWAALVAVSRVFVGKHYLGDVMVGAAVGTLVGYLMAVAASKICKRL